MAESTRNERWPYRWGAGGEGGSKDAIDQLLGIRAPDKKNHQHTPVVHPGGKAGALCRCHGVIEGALFLLRDDAHPARRPGGPRVVEVVELSLTNARRAQVIYHV
eukprot:1185787-Prorocentrum_minimum.AAC.2